MNNTKDRRSLEGETPQAHRNNSRRDASKPSQPSAPVERRTVVDPHTDEVLFVRHIKEAAFQWSSQQLYEPVERDGQITTFATVLGTVALNIYHCLARHAINETQVSEVSLRQIEAQTGHSHSVVQNGLYRLRDHRLILSEPNQSKTNPNTSNRYILLSAQHWNICGGFANMSQTVRQRAQRENKRRCRQAGVVYLITGGGYYKIGLTTNLPVRLHQLGAKLPFKTEIVHAIKSTNVYAVERHWHEHFAAKRIEGEWFQLTPDDVRAFCEIAEWEEETKTP